MASESLGGPRPLVTTDPMIAAAPPRTMIVAARGDRPSVGRRAIRARTAIAAIADTPQAVLERTSCPAAGGRASNTRNQSDSPATTATAA